jgi:hypothetical protein
VGLPDGHPAECPKFLFGAQNGVLSPSAAYQEQFGILFSVEVLIRFPVNRSFLSPCVMKTNHPQVRRADPRADNVITYIAVASAVTLK